MHALRTPDAAFRDLPGYPFAPHFVEDLPGFGGLRMHYLDEGPRASREVFLWFMLGGYWGNFRQKLQLLP